MVERNVAIRRFGSIGTKFRKKLRKQTSHTTSRLGRKQNSKEQLHTRQTEAYKERSKKGVLVVLTGNVE